MNRILNWKKGVFTVEAAVIVPMATVITALLIGYCYYTHQINWYRGAACEAVAAGLKDPDDPETAAEERMRQRTEEQPLNAGNESTEVSSGMKLAVSFEGRILEDVFGSLFTYGGEEALVKMDPVEMKLQEFVLKGLIE